MTEERSYGQNKIYCNKVRKLEALLGLIKLKNTHEIKKNNINSAINFRIQKSLFQKSVLRDIYKLSKFPSKETREFLALILDHSERGIQIWFQNQRHNDISLSKSDLKDKKIKYKRRSISDIEIHLILERHLTGKLRMLWNNYFYNQ